MEVLLLKKERLNGFIEKLQQDFEVIAPLKGDVIRFLPLKNPDDIFLGKNAYFPIKEYFFKKNEVLFQFNGTKIIVPELPSKKRAFFGLRRCDLNAIKHQDMVFMNDIHDPYYTAARKDSYLIGYHCNTAPSPYCFCGSLELADYFDLMVYDKKDDFLVEIGSSKGKGMAKKYASLFSKTSKKISEEEKKIPGSDRLEKKDISLFYNNSDWKKGTDLCLSCGACTALCPTCYCFETHDEVKTSNINEGERKRNWSSCQLQEFTRVAGEHVYRKDREERFKHRIFHQLEYFKEKHKVPLCVGCGRCIEGCPTRIDFVDILNNMKVENG